MENALKRNAAIDSACLDYLRQLGDRFGVDLDGLGRRAGELTANDSPSTPDPTSYM